MMCTPKLPFSIDAIRDQTFCHPPGHHLLLYRTSCQIRFGNEPLVGVCLTKHTPRDSSHSGTNVGRMNMESLKASQVEDEMSTSIPRVLMFKLWSMWCELTMSQNIASSFSHLLFGQFHTSHGLDTSCPGKQLYVYTQFTRFSVVLTVAASRHFLLVYWCG